MWKWRGSNWKTDRFSLVLSGTPQLGHWQVQLLGHFLPLVKLQLVDLLKPSQPPYCKLGGDIWGPTSSMKRSVGFLANTELFMKFQALAPVLAA